MTSDDSPILAAAISNSHDMAHNHILWPPSMENPYHQGVQHYRKMGESPPSPPCHIPTRNSNGGYQSHCGTPPPTVLILVTGICVIAVILVVVALLLIYSHLQLNRSQMSTSQLNGTMERSTPNHCAIVNSHNNNHTQSCEWILVSLPGLGHETPTFAKPRPFIPKCCDNKSMNVGLDFLTQKEMTTKENATIKHTNITSPAPPPPPQLQTPSSPCHLQPQPQPQPQTFPPPNENLVPNPNHHVLSLEC